MTHALRVRIVTAALLLVLLAVTAASPVLSNVTGFGEAAHAAECVGSSC